MKKATSIASVNSQIQKRFPHVELVKGNGYFYIAGTNDTMALKIAGLYTSSIPVCHLNQQTVEQWVKDVENLLNDKL